MPRGDGLTWKTNSFVENLSVNNQDPQGHNASNENTLSKQRPQHNIIRDYYENEMRKRNHNLPNIVGSNSSNNMYQSQQSNAIIENYYSTNIAPIKISDNSKKLIYNIITAYTFLFS